MINPFRKLRRIYNRNPIAYLSLAVIAISLFVGTSIPNLDQTPQILRIEDPNDGDDLGPCKNRNQRDCVGSCVWQKSKSEECLNSFTKDQCPSDCKFTSERSVSCPDITTESDCSDDCKWQEKKTSRCLEYEYKSCTLASCRAGKSGCKSSGTCFDVKNDNPIPGIKTEAACDKRHGDWIKESSCSGKYKSNNCLEYKTIGSCTGPSKTILSKCEPLSKNLDSCVDRPPDPSDDPSDDLSWWDQESECWPWQPDDSNPVNACLQDEECVLDTGSTNFYVCEPLADLPSYLCNPRNNITGYTVMGEPVLINTDCNKQPQAIPENRFYVCARLPEPNFDNEYIYTCQPSNPTFPTLRPCLLQGDWYTHGTTIETEPSCIVVDGLPTGFATSGIECNNSQWTEIDHEFPASGNCPQVARCAMYDLDDSYQRNLFVNGPLDCCNKVDDNLENGRNDHGQKYSDHYDSLCQPSVNPSESESSENIDKTSFLDELLSIFF